MSIDLRFLSPRSTCALCGRDCDFDGAVVLEESEEFEVDVSQHRTHLHCDVTPGSCVVICKECAAAD